MMELMAVICSFPLEVPDHCFMLKTALALLCLRWHDEKANLLAFTTCKHHRLLVSSWSVILIISEDDIVRTRIVHTVNHCFVPHFSATIDGKSIAVKKASSLFPSQM